ncbi:MAG TPA: hypothetical protein VLJ39_06240, partial [Tepidisphaeraceae bacterium]|nr:hypothetical protein [Tepidisphaeraceae bacterium]
YSISIHGPIRWLVLMPLYVLLATLLGVVTAKLVEQPLLRYRDRRFPARPRKIGPASSPVGPVSARPVAAVPSAS